MPEGEEAVSEEVAIEGEEEDEIARLEAEIQACMERIAELEAKAGGYAAHDHAHEGYAGAEHEHAKTEERESQPGGAEETRTESETAPRSSHWYYRRIGDHFSK